MARPRDPAKREALLTAAAELVAQLGPTASPAKIARQAGVSAGTIFVYFPTKDDLLNTLYVHLKANLRRHIHTSPEMPWPQRMRRAWDDYIDWGFTHPLQARALAVLSASERVTPQTRAEAQTVFPEFEKWGAESRDSISAEAAGEGAPAGFLDASFYALADMVIAHGTQQAEEAAKTGSGAADKKTASAGKAGTEKTATPVAEDSELAERRERWRQAGYAMFWEYMQRQPGESYFSARLDFK
ncbi:TetR/AcrR family transcriptional regulator [Oecophyllibacter saccharovorans]|uniref:TetR/AcrR family transcriptional regulator n=1 Tax=Oecophyllibacter saccharovorans TaxID=2558360 RepID=UPI0011419ECA|nr:TetR/AcrR family transcriptional regulator [Oecophyllibacter saccharovorans]QDH15018.1 TetR/AcrR family transcriptional regulator [Oecophyllibacter saccharovorans]